MRDSGSEKAEYDVQSDPHVAGSRSSRDEDGSYVGRQSSSGAPPRV